ncbi:unnamed protein product [Enterobius vermicularis]|uniref:DPPIV_N domain-containing protein n=1 Tax=Enterobius vermicularis TaxID=51028 RepID=A0A0N4VN41_ENTVE|nr:unnamed protein product [Enterobius vermicularis]
MCSKIKDGIYGTWQFGVSSRKDGIYWYIFDMRRSQFVVTEANSAVVRILPFHCSQLKVITGNIKWLGIRGINNSDLILTFLFEQKTGKYYLVTMRDNGDHISVVYEHFIYVERVDELTQAFITKDDRDNLYAMIIWQAGGNGPKTFIHALRINICLPVGMITTRIAADENFDGKWCRPFVIENHLVLRAGIAYSLSVPIRKICKSVDGDSPNKEAFTPKIQYINTGTLINDSSNLFFGSVLYRDWDIHYVHNTIANDGQLWGYHWKSSTWKPLNVRFTRHAFNKFVTMHMIDNMLYMHGDCATKSCKTRAHIHCVDLSDKL